MSRKIIIAAPSWVLPAGIEKNARFLAGRVDEVALCFFESAACLAYGPADLPESLAELPLSWHVHLPVDLPWDQGGEKAARVALAVAGKASFLPLRFAVLHPPDFPADAGAGNLCRHMVICADLLNHFMNVWQSRSAMPVLLENTPTVDTAHFKGHPVLERFELCLDMGHLLGYKQKPPHADGNTMQKVRLAHWSAPGPGDRHLPLSELGTQELETCGRAAALIPENAIHLLEIFNWDGVASSIPVLNSILFSKGIDK